MNDRNIAMARRIAGAVARAGGRTFYVGGWVRDLLLGRENKDVDIEVHGISVEALEAVLDGLGQRTAMGASFGVMGLKHYDIDIAMPRSERATGRGHKDFQVFVDPFIGYEKAARRRDFTMNALMQDVLTGEILDFFGGREDMARGLIRHVNDVTFAEDPLRVFRAAQFAARFGFAVAEETAALSRTMAVDALARERVMGELEKALMKAARPSVFVRELRRMRQLSVWFPELEALPLARRDAADLALDRAAAMKGEAASPRSFMLSAMVCALGEADAARLLGRLTNEAQTTRYVLNMAGRLETASEYLRAGADTDAWMALYDGSVCPEDLILLARAALPDPGDIDFTAREARMRALLAVYRARMAEPFAMGRDLIAAGAAPGARMGEALQCAHRLRLAGASKAEQLAAALDLLRRADAATEKGDDGA